MLPALQLNVAAVSYYEAGELAPQAQGKGALMGDLPVEVGTDDVAAHPRPTGHRWFDITMAVCAIFISAISLFVAIEHGHTERDLVAASSWPFLRSEITNAYGGKRAIEIGISNGGVGPAKVRSYEMTLDGHPIRSPAELLTRCCGLPKDAEGIRKALPNGTVSMSMVDNTVLRPGESNPILVIPGDTTDPELYKKLDGSLLRIKFKACYCSTLDQCWTTNLESLETKPVDECPLPTQPYLYNHWPTAVSSRPEGAQGR